MVGCCLLREAIRCALHVRCGRVEGLNARAVNSCVG